MKWGKGKNGAGPHPPPPHPESLQSRSREGGRRPGWSVSPRDRTERPPVLGGGRTGSGLRSPGPRINGQSARLPPLDWPPKLSPGPKEREGEKASCSDFRRAKGIPWAKPGSDCTSSSRVVCFAPTRHPPVSGLGCDVGCCAFWCTCNYSPPPPPPTPTKSDSLISPSQLKS